MNEILLQLPQLHRHTDNYLGMYENKNSEILF